MKEARKLSRQRRTFIRKLMGSSAIPDFLDQSVGSPPENPNGSDADPFPIVDVADLDLALDQN